MLRPMISSLILQVHERHKPRPCVVLGSNALPREFQCEEFSLVPDALRHRLVYHIVAHAAHFLKITRLYSFFSG